MSRPVIDVDDPRDPGVRSVIDGHLRFCKEHTPPEDVHALELEELVDPAVTFYSYRNGGRVLAIGAIKEVDPGHIELKSMHTVEVARGRGVGRALLDHLLSEAVARGARRVSIETGSMDAFGPARSLYATAGFVPCGPFADYQPSASSVFMTLDVGRAAGRQD